uniref:CUGBP Elav-like family member 4 n=1 Tax=Panthera tigris altaica TaxID=74533 RepID=A0A8C9KTL4_PANTA
MASVAQGGYLNPMAAFAAAQMQQMAALNMNGLAAAPMTPTSGGSTPPGITAPAVPSIPSPIGVNGFTGLPPQANGQPAAEAVFANGIHPYPGKHIWQPFLPHAAHSSSILSLPLLVTGNMWLLLSACSLAEPQM